MSMWKDPPHGWSVLGRGEMRSRKSGWGRSAYVSRGAGAVCFRRVILVKAHDAHR